jgi:hypothetical protein
MKSEIMIIGGGASGLMAAYGAAKWLVVNGSDAQVTVLEKMPRPGRKIMITGKGRCNFTNVKDWNAFSPHIRSKSNFVKPSFYNLDSTAVVDFFESNGMKAVVERGDRAFPASYHASDVVDTLLRACTGYGVKVVIDCPVTGIVKMADGFKVNTADGLEHRCRRLIIATGGLSYPGTGSTGEGLAWAEGLGHAVRPCFPSLTALVPKGYKTGEIISRGKGHIDRSTPLSEYGKSLAGIQLKNISLAALIDGQAVESEFGDVDFTDGGIEGPVGFQLSRRCVKAIINGSKVTLRLDLKPGVEAAELASRVKSLWDEVARDPRSRGKGDRERCRILLGKLMPWELIPAFLTAHPDIVTVKRKAGTRDGSGRYSVGAQQAFVNLSGIAKALKEWDFPIDGFVGYERCVVTAGGVDTDELLPKTMESRLVPGLYFCGEVMDMDCDTGGYNLQAAFCTGFLAGQSAARSLLAQL